MEAGHDIMDNTNTDHNLFHVVGNCADFQHEEKSKIARKNRTCEHRINATEWLFSKVSLQVESYRMGVGKIKMVCAYIVWPDNGNTVKKFLIFA